MHSIRIAYSRIHDLSKSQVYMQQNIPGVLNIVTFCIRCTIVKLKFVCFYTKLFVKWRTYAIHFLVHRSWYYNVVLVFNQVKLYKWENGRSIIFSLLCEKYYIFKHLIKWTGYVFEISENILNAMLMSYVCVKKWTTHILCNVWLYFPSNNVRIFCKEDLYDDHVDCSHVWKNRPTKRSVSLMIRLN